MIISLTGTPGTGKTSVGKKLAEFMDYGLVSVNDLAEKEWLIKGLDKGRETKVIDTDGLRAMDVEGNKIIEGHLSHFIPSDLIVVLRTNPEELRARLVKKGWGKEKIQENLEAEILGVCSSEARAENKNIIEVDTSGKRPEEVAKELKAMITSGKSEEIDWMEEYGDMLIEG